MTVVWAYCELCETRRAGVDTGDGIFTCPSHKHWTIAKVGLPYSEGGP